MYGNRRSIRLEGYDYSRNGKYFDFNIGSFTEFK